MQAIVNGVMQITLQEELATMKKAVMMIEHEIKIANNTLGRLGSEVDTIAGKELNTYTHGFLSGLNLSLDVVQGGNGTYTNHYIGAQLKLLVAFLDKERASDGT